MNKNDVFSFEEDQIQRRLLQIIRTFRSGSTGHAPPADV